LARESFTKKAEKAAEENHIKVIINGCPMMFVDKVNGSYKVLK
jgi:hypothetical protein